MKTNIYEAPKMTVVILEHEGNMLLTSVRIGTDSDERVETIDE